MKYNTKIKWFPLLVFVVDVVVVICMISLLTACVSMSNISSSTVNVHKTGYAVKRQPQLARDGDTNVGQSVLVKKDAK